MYQPYHHHNIGRLAVASPTRKEEIIKVILCNRKQEQGEWTERIFRETKVKSLHRFTVPNIDAEQGGDSLGVR